MNHTQEMIIAFLVVCLVQGAMAIVCYYLLRNWLDKYDSDNTRIKSVQKKFMLWGKTWIFLIFIMPVIHVGALFWYVSDKPVEVQYVAHIFDLEVYGWKMFFWNAIWLLCLLGKGLELLLHGFGVKLPFSVDFSNPVENSYPTTVFFSWCWAFVGSVLFWTWLKKDDGWNWFVRIISYIGSTILIAYAGTFFFRKTIIPLPQSQVIEFLSKKVWKSPAMGGPAPAQYSTENATGVSAADSQIMGFPAMYVYIAIAVILAIILFFWFRKGKKSATTKPSEAGGGKDEKGKAAESTGVPDPPKTDKAQYDIKDYSVDLQLARRYVALFSSYHPTPYYCFDVTQYQDMINRMRSFLASKNLRGDEFFEGDHLEVVESLQYHIAQNAVLRETLPQNLSILADDPGAYSAYAQIMGQIHSAAAKGFYLLIGEYSRFISLLGQYANNISAAAKAEFNQIPPNNQDKKNVHLMQYNMHMKTLTTVKGWLTELEEVHAKVHKVQMPKIEGAPEPPGAFVQFVGSMSRNYPRAFYGTVLFIILLIVLFLFKPFGKSKEPEQVQPQTTTTTTVLTKAEKKNPQATFDDNIHIIAQALCEGKEIPADAKAKVIEAGALIGKKGKAALNAAVTDEKNKICPPTQKE